MKKTKYILPIVAGVMSGMMVQAFGEKGIHSLYPPPSDISLDNTEQLKTFIAHLPIAAFVLLLANYAVSSLISGGVATLIIGRQTAVPAIVAGCLITLAGIFNVAMIPEQPVWFSIASLIIYFPFTMLGYVLAKEKK